MIRNEINLPKMMKVQQHFDHPQLAIKEFESVITEQLSTLHLEEKINPHDTVAITAGSRGIAHIDQIIKVIVAYFQNLGAKPFIFPAMGSHGGGTAEGQKKVLENYGITEKTMNCEIRASMDVKIIGKTSLGTSVFLDKYASKADHIFVVNRIKLHTKLSGRVESGLMKMCLIGMGKREGARTYHREIEHHSWDSIVHAVTDVILSNAPILGGLAIIQNAYEEIAHLIAVSKNQFKTEEPRLLQLSQKLMATIPFNNIDLLIVDEMGKEISGTGMDTNITGRKEGSNMNVLRVFVRDLTDHTHGNAQGIGLADYTLKKLVNKIDFQATYLNAQTAYRTDSCKIPMTLRNDLEVMRIAQQMTGIDDNPASFRVIWIKNTLDLEYFYASEAFLREIAQKPSLSILQRDLTINFTRNGDIYLE